MVFFFSSFLFLVSSIFFFSKPLFQGEKTLTPTVLPEIVEAQKEELRQVFRSECVWPRQLVQELATQFATLVSRQAEKDLDQFLGEQHSFQEMKLKVEDLQQLAQQIQYSLKEVVLQQPV